MSSPEEWHLVPGRGGWWIVDQSYDEEIVFASEDYTHAKQILDEMVRDEIAEQAERAYDRHQEWLMETGGGPSLIEQQQAAYKIKHGLPS